MVFIFAEKWNFERWKSKKIDTINSNFQFRYKLCAVSLKIKTHAGNAHDSHLEPNIFNPTVDIFKLVFHTDHHSNFDTNYVRSRWKLKHTLAIRMTPIWSQTYLIQRLISSNRSFTQITTQISIQTMCGHVENWNPCWQSAWLPFRAKHF